MSDLISRQAAIDIERNATVDTNPSHFEAHQKFTQFMDDAEISSFGRWQWSNGFNTALTAVGMDLKKLPSAQPEQRWIPIKWHNCTDEDREKYGFSNDIVAAFDCEMPDDDQPILVTTSHGYVNQDVCYIGEGFSLDSGWDWIDDIEAWMPLPKPYKEGQDEQT